MPKRSGTTKVVRLGQQRDENQLAASVIARTLELAGEEPAERKKDPAAVALGRRGGLKGGKARMAGLTPDARKALAVKAAKARWSRQGVE